MSRETSLYLDVWRLLLAMVVLLGHLSENRLTGGFLSPLWFYGTEAVPVFFVLSGFVIAYVTETRETSAATFAVARAGRIYSVALPALLLTFALDAAGRSIDPVLYIGWEYSPDGRIWQFLAGVFFLNHIWGNIPQGSNVSYWSLGCEAWFYVMFGTWVFAPARWRRAALMVELVFVGPLTALLFPLWLLGVIGYRTMRTQRPGQRAGWFLLLTPLVLWGAFEATADYHGRFFYLVPWRLHRRPLIEDYIVGLLFMTHLIGFQTVSANFTAPLAKLAPQIRWASGATFSLYLFHMPIAQFLAACSDWAPGTVETRILVVGGTISLIFILAEITERRKDPWRRLFARVLVLFSPGPARAARVEKPAA